MAVPKWARENMAKSGGQPTFGVVSKPSPFHSQEVKHLADGTPSEDEFKRMGIEASNRYREIEKSQETGVLDKISGALGRTWDRIKAGNIDAPGSRAYEQYGAGLGKKEYEAEQDRKQSVVDSERARKEYVPETGESIARRMGRVSPVGSAVDSPAPATSSPTTEVKKTDSEWDTLQRSSDKSTPPSEGTKPNGIFSNPNYGGTTAAEPKAEDKKPAPRRVPRKAATNKTAASTSNVSMPDNQRPPVDNATRKEKPGARGGDNETRPSKETPTKSVPNDQRPSKPYPADAKPKGKSSDSSSESEVQKAGARYAATKRALDNAPKETSPTARKALEAAVEAALRDYEAKAKSIKR